MYFIAMKVALIAVALGVAVGQSPTTLPNVATSFVVAKQWNNCSNFPGCPQHGEGSSKLTN
jgi:hypothetical protein